ncbi:MAG: hypothetical protein CL678_11745 [Bdellovibrionaceae bacterium]|nr:hypothetical protein [Pseudobdellovibrionaceae bacterium]|tara:strand:+ start:460 stop:1215 length:756 start_codon:yes stop_codon:yes gene_type:complete
MSALTDHPNVRQLVEAISNRDIEFFEGVRDSSIKGNGGQAFSPSHLMFACAQVIGDSEPVRAEMGGVPGREKKNKLIDLCIKLCTAPDEGEPVVEEVVQVEEPQAVEPPSEVPVIEVNIPEEVAVQEPSVKAKTAPKKKRRSSAEVVLEPVLEEISEITKAVYTMQNVVEAQTNLIKDLSEKVSHFIQICERTSVDTEANNSFSKASFAKLNRKLDAIKNGVVAAELELVMNGKLESSAMSDCIDEEWPNR